MSSPEEKAFSLYLMKDKLIIIIGKPESGKTLKGKEIASLYNEENVTWIDGHTLYNKNSSHFYWSRCNLNTELVIIDDIKDVSKIDKIYSLISEGVVVEKRFQNPFRIHPKIIIICSSEISLDDLPTQSKAFNRRFLIINCDYERGKRKCS
jgi:ABC-type microcin C transport system duplicated ATPase subunit YejF